MTDHQDIMRIVGNLEGEMRGVRSSVESLGETIKEQSKLIAGLQVDGAIGRTKMSLIGAGAGFLASAFFKWVFKV